MFCLLTYTLGGIFLILYTTSNHDQLIRKGKDAAGHDRFKRLDMAKSAVRDKVSHAMTNDELDHIFDTDGFFMAKFRKV